MGAWLRRHQQPAPPLRRLEATLEQRTELGRIAGDAARRAQHPLDKRDVADDALVSIANSLAALVILVEHDLETRQ